MRLHVSAWGHAQARAEGVQAGSAFGAVFDAVAAVDSNTVSKMLSGGGLREQLCVVSRTPEFRAESRAASKVRWAPDRPSRGFLPARLDSCERPAVRRKTCTNHSLRRGWRPARGGSVVDLGLIGCPDVRRDRLRLSVAWFAEPRLSAAKRHEPTRGDTARRKIKQERTSTGSRPRQSDRESQGGAAAASPACERTADGR